MAWRCEVPRRRRSRSPAGPRPAKLAGAAAFCEINACFVRLVFVVFITRMLRTGVCASELRTCVMSQRCAPPGLQAARAEPAGSAVTPPTEAVEKPKLSTLCKVRRHHPRCSSHSGLPSPVRLVFSCSLQPRHILSHNHLSNACEMHRRLPLAKSLSSRPRRSSKRRRKGGQFRTSGRKMRRRRWCVTPVSLAVLADQRAIP